MANYETGTCSVCGREELRVLKNGTVGRHNSYSPNTGVVSRCSGYGKPSIERRRADRATTTVEA